MFNLPVLTIGIFGIIVFISGILGNVAPFFAKISVFEKNVWIFTSGNDKFYITHFFGDKSHEAKKSVAFLEMFYYISYQCTPVPEYSDIFFQKNVLSLAEILYGTDTVLAYP